MVISPAGHGHSQGCGDCRGRVSALAARRMRNAAMTSRVLRTDAACAPSLRRHGERVAAGHRRAPRALRRGLVPRRRRLHRERCLCAESHALPLHVQHHRRYVAPPPPSCHLNDSIEPPPPAEAGHVAGHVTAVLLVLHRMPCSFEEFLQLSTLRRESAALRRASQV